MVDAVLVCVGRKLSFSFDFYYVKKRLKIMSFWWFDQTKPICFT